MGADAARLSWNIRDAAGTIVAVHERHEEADGGKRFVWRQASGQVGLGGRAVTELPLYGSERLPDDELVVVCEGEKAADAVFRAGFASAGTVTGAASCPSVASLSVLIGHPVVFFPDADGVGQAHMERAGLRTLELGVSDVRMVAPNGWAPGTDAADLTEAEIVAAIAGAAPWAPPREMLRREDPDEREFPAPIGAAAWHGLAGEIVQSISPLTEAEPAGLLALILTIYGALAGHWKTLYQGSHQAANIYTLLVGDSSHGRKGTAWGVARDVFAAAVPGWESILVPGLGSGEALIEHLRPPDDPKPGEMHEHRALILESEYSRLLSAMSRQGSTLSPVVRDAWDGQPIGRFLARSRTLVLWHHVALVAMITPQELRQVLTTTDQANGFANRHLHVAVRAARWLPFPESVRGAVTPHLQPLRVAIAVAQQPGELRWSMDGAFAWEAFYNGLRAGREPGLLGAMLARAEAQVSRLALLYALLDRSSEITDEHLAAALAVWDYVVRSTVWVYGRSTGNRDADTLLRTLRVMGPLDATELREATGLYKSSDRDEIVRLLVEQKLIRREVIKTGRRPKIVVSAIIGAE